MPRASYRGDKRRREIAKKKKREEKLKRKQTGGEGAPEGEDTSYLEYLNPGGVQAEFEDDDDDDESSLDETDDADVTDD